MRQTKFWFRMSGAVAMLAMVLILQTEAAAASTNKILYEFKGVPDGSTPLASLIFDAAGNLYGTTAEGGSGVCSSSSGCGTVFKLTPNADGSWTESVLYSFCSLSNCADGGNPGASLIAPDVISAGLIFDGAGNLYGTTTQGGSGAGCGISGGCGVVFKLTPNADGSWTESVLYNFCSLANCADGENPGDGLIFDKVGNLYGTTPGGGHPGCNDVWPGCGVVFKLTPNSGGGWTESVLYRFCSLSGCADGAAPVASLIFDGAGNLYGTTLAGGSNNSGTVFQLKPHTGGSWTENVLFRFNGIGDSGQAPEGPLVFDAAGNLYGTTSLGGVAGNGLVFKLKPSSGGLWTESVIHYFYVAAGPNGSLTFDAAGNLYGTTNQGGFANNGQLFKLAPQSGGGWAYSVPRYFYGKPSKVPIGGVVLDKAGNLYGTTDSCGSGYTCQGVVYEFIP
jgi:uncharacterized repeat protein (TIGR03803 family)